MLDSEQPESEDVQQTSGTGADHSAEEKPEPASLLPVLLTEFIGTFFLVFTVTLNVAEEKAKSSGAQAPLAIGGILMVMIFCGGHISGGHFNPAVTLAVTLRGKLAPWRTAFYYMIVQVAGGFAAALLGFACTGRHPAPTVGWTAGAAFVSETLFTFALAYVVLNVATTKSQENNHFFGLAIGFAVVAGAYSSGDISGSVFNPAVGTGLTVVDAFAGGTAIQYLWIYWLAPMLGGFLAAFIFHITNKREFRNQDGPLSHITRCF